MIKPLLFVAMPFGKKRDSTELFEIDFDLVYNNAIKPAAEDSDLDIIRADEERSGGIIHIPMYERLLLAEIVLVDLTLSNANVFYELGVRHCAKPKTTIPIYAKENQLPFDVHMIRAIPYELDDGILSSEQANILKQKITERLDYAKEHLESQDSPLFQLIRNFPGIDLPHDVTESFRDRALYIDGKRTELNDARSMQDKKKSLKAMKEIERSFGDLSLINSELLIDLLLSYRDINAYNEMIELVERIPPIISSISTIQEQYAFALNRRNQQYDRNKAIQVLLRVIEEFGNSPETYGLLGRIYKDFWKEAKTSNNPVLISSYLEESINYYRKGFETDPRDYYPGINLLTLLFIKGTDDAREEMKQTHPVVSFAVTRRDGIDSNNYWDVATVLELAVLNQDWPIAFRAVGKATIKVVPTWNFQTTLDNLQEIRENFTVKSIDTIEIDKIIEIVQSVIK